MSDITQCYRILGARPGATSAELKQAYRDLVKIWHPDRFQGDARLQHKAQEQLKKINSAYRQIIASSSDSHPTEIQPDRNTEHCAAGVYRPRAKPRRGVAFILLFFSISSVMIFSLLLIQKDLAEIFFNLGTVFVESGHSNEALCVLKVARWMNPENPKVHLTLGNLYYSLKSCDQAEAAYSEAAARNPQFDEPQHRLALLYIHQGSLDRAIDLLEKAVRVNPSSALLFNDLGSAYGVRGDHREEIETYERAIRIKPEFAAAHFNLAMAKLSAGDYSAVSKEIQVLRTLDPSLANKVSNLAVKK